MGEQILLNHMLSHNFMKIIDYYLENNMEVGLDSPDLIQEMKIKSSLVDFQLSRMSSSMDEDDGQMDGVQSGRRREAHCGVRVNNKVGMDLLKSKHVEQLPSGRTLTRSASREYAQVKKPFKQVLSQQKNSSTAADSKSVFIQKENDVTSEKSLTHPKGSNTNSAAETVFRRTLFSAHNNAQLALSRSQSNLSSKLFKKLTRANDYQRRLSRL